MGSWPPQSKSLMNTCMVILSITANKPHGAIFNSISVLLSIKVCIHYNNYTYKYITKSHELAS